MRIFFFFEIFVKTRSECSNRKITFGIQYSVIQISCRFQFFEFHLRNIEKSHWTVLSFCNGGSLAARRWRGCSVLPRRSFGFALPTSPVSNGDGNFNGKIIARYNGAAGDRKYEGKCRRGYKEALSRCFLGCTLSSGRVS